MQTINKTYLINASLEKVWEALVNPKIIEKWTGSPAQMSEEVGENFKLWDGDIHGKNTDVIKFRRLIQEWYSGSWEKPSIVKIELEQESDQTRVNMIHENVPDKEIKSINSGWDDYYFGPLKKLVEK